MNATRAPIRMQIIDQVSISVVMNSSQPPTTESWVLEIYDCGRNEPWWVN